MNWWCLGLAALSFVILWHTFDLAGFVALGYETGETRRLAVSQFSVLAGWSMPRDVAVGISLA